MSISWSASRFDAWLTTPPEQPDIPMPGEPFYPRCDCGAFLKREPNGMKYIDYPDPDTGEVMHVSEIELRECAKCGKLSEICVA